MIAGGLSVPITIQVQQQTGVGDRGQPIYTWQNTVPTLRAKVEDLSGRRLEVARQLVSTATHQITIRYLPGLSTRGTRVIVNGLIHNIRHIANKGEKNFTLVLTTTSEEGQVVGLPAFFVTESGDEILLEHQP